MTAEPLHLFEGFGVELEYMLVDAETLEVVPRVDEVLAAAAGGEMVSEVELGDVAWSNELVLHVLELKTSGPAPRLEPLASLFHENVEKANVFAGEMGARLMPGAMHPWMDPGTETVLWPHEHSPVYEAFDRIFGCQGHGWSNLQSAHLNLPFCGDDEFGRLHAAIRLVLPLLPGLAASSPVVDGRVTGFLDSRLEAYRTNARRIPSVTAEVVPEAAFTRSQYERQILRPMYRDVAPLDPEGVLQDEFLNARGAIARFSRGSIEIRVLDVQECPRADLAVVAAIVATLRMCIEDRADDFGRQQACETGPLAAHLRDAIRDGERAVISDHHYLEVLGVRGGSTTVSEVWSQLIDRAIERGHLADPVFGHTLETLLERGPLARRLLDALGPEPSRARVEAAYRRLCDCLASNEMFDVLA